MTQIALTGGFYQTKSIIAGAQRCLNLFPEKNAPDAPFPFTCYLTPGLVELAQGPVSEVRGEYTASDGTLWTVIGAALYWVAADLTLNAVGTLNTAAGPVSMKDNRIVLVVVDGTADGWWVDMASKTMTQIVDDAFYGADAVDLLDTFFLFNRPGTNVWYISPSEWDGIIAFDPLDFAAMTGSSNGLATLKVVNRQVWLFGDRDYGEIWYNVGTPDFTFGRMPGVAIQHGAAAKHSVAAWDTMLFWLGRDDAGDQQVFMGADYRAKIITEMAISAAIAGYETVSDAIGFCYQENGHVFYVLIFPTADKTWVYDITEGLWHERCWADSDGAEHRIRANCQAFAYGKQVVGDWENGKLYQQTTDVYTDAGQPIPRRRGFPHIVANADKIVVRNFVADMDVGQAVGTLTTDPAQVSLQYSITKGASWGNPVVASVGSAGQYLTNIQFNQLGMGRDWVFELFWDFAAKTALNGAWIDAVKLPT